MARREEKVGGSITWFRAVVKLSPAIGMDANKPTLFLVKRSRVDASGGITHLATDRQQGQGDHQSPK